MCHSIFAATLKGVMKQSLAILPIFIASLLSAPALAELARADGKYGGAAEGYVRTILVDFDQSGKFNSQTTGRLHIGQNEFGNWLLYFQAPLSFVDNSYGVYQASDWKKGNSGKVREHTFDDLLKSDMLGATRPLVLNTKQGEVGLKIDYLTAIYSNSGVLKGFGADLLNDIPGVSVSSSLAYNLSNVTAAQLAEYANQGKGNNGNGKGNNGNGKGNKKPATDGSISNPLFNSPFSPDFVSSDEWIWEVGYEVVLDNSYFDDGWLNQPLDGPLFSLGDLHASPSKKDSLASGGYLYCDQGEIGQCGKWAGAEPDVGDVVEPSAIAGWAAFFGFLFSTRRRPVNAPLNSFEFSDD